MTNRFRVAPGDALKCAFAGVVLAGGVLAMAGQAAADPDVIYPTPVPADPPAAASAPGQPVAEVANEPAAPQPPPPVGPPPVPEIQNPAYGQGQTPGKFGYIRDLWHAFHSGNPIEALTVPPEQAPGPPPGAGPPPPLPPGFISLTAPESSTIPAAVPGPPPGPDAGPPPGPQAPPPPAEPTLLPPTP